MEEDEELTFDCGNCGSEVTEEEYNRTGTYDFCESCPELKCGDPRGHTFGYCGCDDT